MRKKYNISVFFSELNVNFDHLVHFFVDH
ncbi:hypothetical protein SM68_00042, partial [Klebsiella pneumoniae]